jgi:hypothetical protein
MNIKIALFGAADTLKTDTKTFFRNIIVSLNDYTIPKTLWFRRILFTHKYKDTSNFNASARPLRVGECA